MGFQVRPDCPEGLGVQLVVVTPAAFCQAALGDPLSQVVRVALALLEVQWAQCPRAFHPFPVDQLFLAFRVFLFCPEYQGHQLVLCTDIVEEWGSSRQ